MASSDSLTSKTYLDAKIVILNVLVQKWSKAFLDKIFWTWIGLCHILALPNPFSLEIKYV